LPAKKKPAIITKQVVMATNLNGNREEASSSEAGLPPHKEVILLLDPSRDRLRPPICPFCRQRIEPPQELDGLWFEFDGGTCRCGAHYALDPTARNGGAVLLQAVVQACGGDWDQAITLSPGEDYEEGIIASYSSLNHRVGGNAFGTLYFIRLKNPPESQETSGTQ
jgi:hypothetical protein